jgi:hypothetical protein
MKFTLHYRGPLLASGNSGNRKEASKNKHDIRECLRLQLEDLWGREPLSGQNPSLLNSEYGSAPCLKKAGKWNFTSIVNANLGLVAELDILFLRPGEPGGLIGGGDIDNRLKTLFDALSIPTVEQMKGKNPADDEGLFHCVLEDDKLITGIDVKVDRLLGDSQPEEVLLYIRVNVSCTHATMHNPTFSLFA